MIKNYLSSEVLKEVLSAIKLAHGGRELILCDLDGVVANFKPVAEQHAREMNMSYEEFAKTKQYKHIEGYFRHLPVMEGALESLDELLESGKYEIILVSAASWDNVSSFSDKRMWVEQYMGEKWAKKLDLSYNKGHYLANHIIDDRTKYGVENFIGNHLHFGSESCSGWEDVLKQLL